MGRWREAPEGPTQEEPISISRSRLLHNSLTTPGKDEWHQPSFTKGVTRHETRFRFDRIFGDADRARHGRRDRLQHRLVGGSVDPRPRRRGRSARLLRLWLWLARRIRLLRNLLLPAVHLRHLLAPSPGVLRTHDDAGRRMGLQGRWLRPRCAPRNRRAAAGVAQEGARRANADSSTPASGPAHRLSAGPNLGWPPWWH